MLKLPNFNLKNKIAGINLAFKRYPWSILALVITAFIISWDIEGANFEALKPIISGIVLALSLAAAQSAKENEFFVKKGLTLPAFLLALLVAPVHYLIIKGLPDSSIQLGIRSFILLLSLLILFILLAVIKSKYKFEENLLAAFKNFFQSLLFSLVLFAGVAIVLAAIDLLFFSVDYRFYMHLTNFVFVLFAPIFFLSLTPDFSRQENAEDLKALQSKLSCPRFLEILLSYIIIPLTWIFSAILVVYILMNITGDFWQDNLLEPMLIFYSATVILLYLLGARIDNPWANFFRKRIPFVLLPIVMFQLAASVFHLGQGFLTYQRYFVLVYGTFAFIAALIFALQALKRTTLIAILMIVFLLGSIFPGINVFRLSANSHIKSLENILNNYDMLQNNSLVIAKKVEEADQRKIIEGLRYLAHLDELDRLVWLSEDFNVYSDVDYKNNFGFSLYSPGIKDKDSMYIYYSLREDLGISIQGYDFLGQMNVFFGRGGVQGNEFKIDSEDENYIVYFDYKNEQCSLNIVSSEKETFVFGLQEFLDDLIENVEIGELSLKEATYLEENEKIKIKFILQFFDLYNRGPEQEVQMSFYLLVGFK